MKLADLPVRVVLGMDINAPLETGRRPFRHRAELTDEQVRVIRRMYWRGVRWKEGLNQKYQKGAVHWKLQRRKSRLSKKITLRYGQEALARRFSRSSATILDIVRRRTYREVD